MDKLIVGALLGFGAGWLYTSAKCSAVVDRGLKIDGRGKPLAGLPRRRKRRR